MSELSSSSSALLFAILCAYAVLSSHSLVWSDNELITLRFDATRDEWARTFPDAPSVSGPVHVWGRCVGRCVRFIFALEPLDMRMHSFGDTGFPRQSAGNNNPLNQSTLLFVVDGETVTPQLGTYVGQFVHYLLEARNLAQPLLVSVKGWSRVHPVSLLGCVDDVPPADGTVVVSVNMYDSIQSGPQGQNNYTELAIAVEKHARFHTCDIPHALNWVYEVWIDETMMATFSAHEFLVQNVSLILKSNTLPRISGEGHRYFPIYNNMALLKWWRRNARVLLVDLDEFLTVSSASTREIEELTFQHDIVGLERLNRVCVDCNVEMPDVFHETRAHKWQDVGLLQDRKLFVNPDVAGCHWIHWATCSLKDDKRPEVHVAPVETAFLAHYPNFFRHRIHATQPKGNTT